MTSAATAGFTVVETADSWSPGRTNRACYPTGPFLSWAG